MSDKPTLPNLRKLLLLLDRHIYSTFSSSRDAYTLSSHISWENINKVFSSKELLVSSLSLYNQTIVRETGKSLFKSSPFVVSCEVNDTGLDIVHNAAGLSVFLSSKDRTAIENSAVTNLFLSALEKFKMRGDILYHIISKGEQYNSSPEELKETLGITYTNAMLKSRVLRPVENSINELYQSGLLPFYIKTTAKRAVIGMGHKTTDVVIDIFHEIEILKLSRMRKASMDYIMGELIKFFPFDYPFIENDLNQVDDKTIDDVCNMIKNIKSDPDFGKLAVPALVKYKLQHEFRIPVKA